MEKSIEYIGLLVTFIISVILLPKAHVMWQTSDLVHIQKTIGEIAILGC